MISGVVHIGVTVRDLDRSIAFYRDVMGLTQVGALSMEGEETDRLFGGHQGCRARVAYLKGDSDPKSPPVELIQFLSEDAVPRESDLFTTSISEICFTTDDIQKEYERMKALGVEFLSPPQSFDFTKDGFGKSKAIYFKDPDGIILELVEDN